MTAVLLVVGVCSLGGAVAWRFASREDTAPGRVLLAVGLGPLVGFDLFSIAWFLVALSPWSMRWALFPVAAILAALLFPWKRPRSDRESFATWGITGQIGMVVLISALVIVSVRILEKHRELPRGGVDSVAIWMTSARVQLRTDGNTADLLTRLDRAHHLDYPLFLPGSLAGLWHLAGDEDTSHGIALQLAFLAGYVALVLSVFRRRGHAKIAPWLALALLTAPVTTALVVQQFADLALAYAVLAAIALADDERAGSSRVKLAGFLWGLLPWIKNEGIAIGLLAFTCFVAFSPRRSIMLARRWWEGAAIPLSGLVLFKWLWAPPNDLVTDSETGFSERLLDPDRWRVVADAFGEQLTDVLPGGFWAILLPALATAAIIARVGRNHARDRDRFLVALSLSLLAAWFVVYAATPRPLEWHLQTSLRRLLYQILPVLTLWGLGHSRET